MIRTLIGQGHGYQLLGYGSDPRDLRKAVVPTCMATLLVVMNKNTRTVVTRVKGDGLHVLIVMMLGYVDGDVT